MKAVITNDQGNLSLLKLRLVAEGANDRTLMLLLELQYPMIHRSQPDYLDIPIASYELLKRQTALALTAGVAVTTGSLAFECNCYAGDTMVIRALWDQLPMMGARLRLQNQQDCEVISLTINGRTVPVEQPCDVYPGAVVDLTVRGVDSIGLAAGLTRAAPCPTCGAPAGNFCHREDGNARWERGRCRQVSIRAYLEPFAQ